MRIRLSFGALYRGRCFCLVALALSLMHSLASAGPPKIWEQVSGDKALEHVQRLVDLGPRPPASEAIEKSRAYIEKQLAGSGWKVTRQAFTDDTPRGKVGFVNLVAQFQGREKASTAPLFLLCSHYDTKWF